MARAEEIVQNYDPSLENKLKQLKMSLQDRLETIHSLDTDILDTLEDEKEIEEAGVFSEKVLEIVVEIESVLLQKTQDNHEHGAPPPSQASQGPAIANKHAKLPRFASKNFYGDPSQWLTFWDSFRSAVHENPELQNIDKFNYLRSLLHGSATSTIAGLPLTSDNYSAAIDLLTKRFGNKQVIISRVISSHINSFLKLTPLQNAPDTRKLRQTFDKIEAHVRG